MKSKWCEEDSVYFTPGYLFGIFYLICDVTSQPGKDPVLALTS